MKLPILCPLVIPADYQPGGPRYYAPRRQLAMIVQGMIHTVQRYVASQVGMVFATDFRVIETPRTMVELATEGNPPVPGLQLDEYDQSFSGTRVGEVVSAAYGIAGSTEPHRILGVVIGGGGFAGAYGPNEHNQGAAYVGDWGVYYLATGQPNFGCVGKHVAGVKGRCPGAITECSPDETRVADALIHEFLHLFGVADAPQYVGGDEVELSARNRGLLASRGQPWFVAL